MCSSHAVVCLQGGECHVTCFLCVLRRCVAPKMCAGVVHICFQEGYARLSSHRYSADPATLSNRFIHLTNSSIQKKSKTQSDTISNAGSKNAGGTKTSLSYLWRRLASKGWNPKKLWADITQLIVKSLVCVDDVIPYQPNSFEMFGYDVLLDDTGRPWLVEVNSSPSLGTDSDMDFDIKTQLLMDTIQVVRCGARDHAFGPSLKPASASVCSWCERWGCFYRSTRPRLIERSWWRC